MKEFKNLQELVLKAEELILRIEDANEIHAQRRSELKNVTNDTRHAITSMDRVIKNIPRIENSVNTIVSKVNKIDAEKIKNDINDSFGGASIEFDWEKIEEIMNQRLVELFREMHIEKFANHVDSHMRDYNLRCQQIDTSINKLQTMHHIPSKLEKKIIDFEHSLNRLQTKYIFAKSTVLLSLGALAGSIFTYFII